MLEGFGFPGLGFFGFRAGLGGVFPAVVFQQVAAARLLKRLCCLWWLCFGVVCGSMGLCFLSPFLELYLSPFLSLLFAFSLGCFSPLPLVQRGCVAELFPSSLCQRVCWSGCLVVSLSALGLCPWVLLPLGFPLWLPLLLPCNVLSEKKAGCETTSAEAVEFER